MKNTLKTLTGIAAVASLSAMASFGAHAQSNQIEAKDSGFYVGGNYGYLRVEGEDDFLVTTATTSQVLKQTVTLQPLKVFCH